jgi:prephenate dehydratase
VKLFAGKQRIEMLRARRRRRQFSGEQSHEMDAIARHDVAFQGVAAAFAEEAALAFGGAPARTLPCHRLEEVFDAVESGAARFGALPIENSLAGPVLPSYDLLAARPLGLVGEVVLRVSHALIAPRGVRFEAIRRVLSHPVALAQCEEFFRKNPQIEAVAAYNTAGAARDVILANTGDAAAIASSRAADVHGGVVLLRELEDHPQNFTRFLLVAQAGASPPEGAWSAERKTSLIVTLPHRPGTLAAALNVFADRALDLSKIESRPLRGRPFEYAFFIDLVGDAADPALADAIREIGLRATTVRVLGSYAALAGSLARSPG